jgi:threonylcarbamoyladenosine tRNA methylthiotransferase MtaB
MVDTSILQGKKVAFFTLGCKLNFAETSTIGLQLAQYGVAKAAKGEYADICIINTCSVTEVADHKCRQAINKLIKNNPGAFVVVVGCYAQLKPQQISEIPGVDLVLGAEHKGKIVYHLMKCMSESRKDILTTKTSEIKTFAPSCSRGDRTRYFLKVQDGCNYYCTYCTIPIARGCSRNGSVESLVCQAREVAAEGGKEIVITGVNIGDFGHTTGESFFNLVRELDKVEGIERYRISSIEPNLLTDEIIEYVAQSRSFMPHFHIPLQSGSDEVLRLMRRKYDTNLFARKVERIKSLMPHAFIGVDVIVGTRGERDEYFEDAYRFIEGLDVSQLHVFSYSERPGTKALEIPYVVKPEVKHERSQRLITLSGEKTKAFYKSVVGSVRPVLFEHTSGKNKPMHGFTDNYIRVEIPNTPDLDNCIVPVRLGDMNESGDALWGTVL